MPLPRIVVTGDTAGTETTLTVYPDATATVVYRYAYATRTVSSPARDPVASSEERIRHVARSVRAWLGATNHFVPSVAPPTPAADWRVERGYVRGDPVPIRHELWIGGTKLLDAQYVAATGVVALAARGAFVLARPDFEDRYLAELEAAAAHVLDHLAGR